MRLQGRLQNVFDALYQLGVIDPVLKKDWRDALKEYPRYETRIHKAIEVANAYEGIPDLLSEKLKVFDSTTLEYLAMEVAREFADYESRQTLH